MDLILPIWWRIIPDEFHMVALCFSFVLIYGPRELFGGFINGIESDIEFENFIREQEMRHATLSLAFAVRSAAMVATRYNYDRYAIHPTDYYHYIKRFYR